MSWNFEENYYLPLCIVHRRKGKITTLQMIMVKVFSSNHSNFLTLLVREGGHITNAAYLTTTFDNKWVHIWGKKKKKHVWQRRAAKLALPVRRPLWPNLISWGGFSSLNEYLQFVRVQNMIIWPKLQNWDQFSYSETSVRKNKLWHFKLIEFQIDQIWALELVKGGQNIAPECLKIDWSFYHRLKILFHSKNSQLISTIK